MKKKPKRNSKKKMKGPAVGYHSDEIVCSNTTKISHTFKT